VNRFRASPFFRSRYPLAIAAGLLLAASFPKIGIAGLAWVAPGLMLAAALGKSGAERFRIGYVAGLTHYLAALYWLLLIPYRWHGIPFGPATGWLALSAYLALFPATWVWLVSEGRGARGEVRSAKRAGRDQKPTSNLQPATFNLQPSTFGDRPSTSELQSPDIMAMLGQSWMQRTVWAISGAAAWVALEMAVARLLGGFPWDLLGVSQYQMLPLIQIASITGVYGVSFLVVWVSLSLLSAALMVIRQPTPRSVWVGEILLPVLVVAALFHVGFRQLRPEPPPTRTLNVTLVQPSIPQTLIWDTGKDAERFGDLLRLSEQALTNRTDVLIWPEAAVPSYARWDTNICPAITNLVRQHHLWLILGSDDLGRPARPARADDYEFYNASFLVNREGEFVTRYRKRNLVIFGEYVPLTRWLPFLKWFTPIQGGFTPGDRAVPFELTDLGVKASVLICFEDVFPHLARGDVQPDTDLLVNLTNDGWFGESAAQWQQAATAVFRTVENGVPLIRCSNNGLTCWADAHGRLRRVFRDDQGSVYGAGFMTVEIPLLAPGADHAPTFYNRHGDLFGWACVGIAGLVLVRRIVPRRTAPGAAAT
jgi:apolipoprotein N-acyltransferase